MEIMDYVKGQAADRTINPFAREQEIQYRQDSKSQIQNARASTA